MQISVCSVKVCPELSIFIYLSQISQKSQVSLRSVSGKSQVSLRSVSGQSQVSLSDLTLSVRRNLKYFVLFMELFFTF